MADRRTHTKSDTHGRLGHTHPHTVGVYGVCVVRRCGVYMRVTVCCMYITVCAVCMCAYQCRCACLCESLLNGYKCVCVCVMMSCLLRSACKCVCVTCAMCIFVYEYICVWLLCGCVRNGVHMCTSIYMCG